MNTKSRSEFLKNPKIKAYVLIGVSILLIILAVFLVTSNRFWYNVQNIDYYQSQYEYTESMSSGYFASDYRYLALQWKELYFTALIYIICHIVGAIILSVVGGIGLYKGIVNFKKIKPSSDERKLN